MGQLGIVTCCVLDGAAVQAHCVGADGCSVTVRVAAQHRIVEHQLDASYSPRSWAEAAEWSFTFGIGVTEIGQFDGTLEVEFQLGAAGDDNVLIELY